MLTCPSLRHQNLIGLSTSLLDEHAEVPGSSLPSMQSQKSSLMLSTGTLRTLSKQLKTRADAPAAPAFSGSYRNRQTLVNIG